MAKAAKLFLGFLIFIVLLISLGIVAITQWVNPNDFKPFIEDQAAKQGVSLDMRGELSWQFFPSFGLSIGPSTVYETSAKRKVLASIEQAQAKVAVSPLLNKQLVIETLLLDGFNANLAMDQNGNGNWEPLIKAHRTTADADATTPESSDQPSEPAATPTDTPTKPSEQPLPLELMVHHIEIRDGHLDFSDAQQQRDIELSNINLRLTDVNLSEVWFPLTLGINAKITQAQQTFVAHSELSTRLKINNRLDHVAIESGQLKTQIARSLSALQAKDINTLALAFSADVSELSTMPRWQAQAKLQPFNAKQLFNTLNLPLPETSSPDVLQKVGLSLQTQGTLENITLAPVTVLLDQTTLKIDIKTQDAKSIFLKASGDTINLDDYLPPSHEEQADTATNAETKETPKAQTDQNTPEPEDPFAALRTFAASLDLHWDHLIVSKLHVDDFTLKANNRNGVADISQLSMDFYEGKMQLQGKLDARRPNSKLRLTGDVANVQLNPLLKDLLDNPSAEQYTLAGSAFSTLNVASQGKTITQLIENIDAVFEARTKALQLAPVNIQRYVCQAVVLLSKKTLPETTWPESTQLQDVKAVIHLRDQIATLEKFNAGVENFVLSSLGEFNLKEQTLDFRFPVTLLELAQQPEGCPKPNERLINQSLSLLKCKGSLENPACKLDSVAIREKLKSLLAAKAQKELKPHQDKLKNKLEQKLKDKLKKKFGDDAEEKLKNLFKRP